LFVGGPLWKKLQQEQKLTSATISPPQILVIPDLLKQFFSLLQEAQFPSSEQKAKARRIAACWYHIATQVDYAAQPSDEINDAVNPKELYSLIETTATILSVAVGGGSVAEQSGDTTTPYENLLDENYHSDDDEDFNMGQEDDDDEDIEDDGDEGEEEDGEAASADSLNKDGDTNMTEADEEDEEDEEDIPELAAAEVPEKEREVSNVILKTVELLHAYMPSPNEDVDWFKRVLKGIRAVQRDPTGDKIHWYPFGLPPVEHYQQLVNSEEKYLKEHAQSVLNLFKSVSN